MKKILVIEDEKFLREDLLEILEHLEFQGIEAENGAVGVQLARQHLPDLIICDVMMPELDGYGVCTTLRQYPETATIPFIFLSAKTEKSAVRQGMALGADDYLTKPFSIVELSQAISTQLEKKVIIDKQYQKKLDDLRSNIALSLPHELRTPLQAILSLSDILVEEYDVIESDAKREMIGDISNSAQRLSRLIQKFILYAQLEIIATDAEQVEKLRSSKTYSPKSMIKHLAMQKARQAGREADLQLNLQNANIPISETYWQIITDEVIDNAFKFSPMNTQVRIKSIVSNSSFILSVFNQGQGMTAEQIANVGAYMQFERKMYEQQGSGLGLIIAKRLVNLHGGKLTIESIPGRQTKVEITLPTVED
ncbi:MAG: response regulator [Aphanothece sp. CMT-3BRIN-NPC111]|nr:response regulator [Aphanothece sp. CMT-3BRIN-NPC111]